MYNYAVAWAFYVLLRVKFRACKTGVSTQFVFMLETLTVQYTHISAWTRSLRPGGACVQVRGVRPVRPGQGTPAQPHCGQHRQGHPTPTTVHKRLLKGTVA